MAQTLKHNFPIVGVGASAGGIESFKKFLGAIPEQSDMAYVLVQHLSPSHESILPEILSRLTNLPVNEITNDCEIHPNNIYVLPENHLLEITTDSLKLKPRKSAEQNLPINEFFCSLAEVHGQLSVGIVLSGTARDGTVGLRKIKEEGGLTFAEDPESAGWSGMPKSAIDAGVVDFVLRTEDMPKKLIEVFNVYEIESAEQDIQEKWDNVSLKKIFSLLIQRSGIDFSYYKKPTILRRITRRMAIKQISDPQDYINLLREENSEKEALVRDLLIKVSSFFRDPEMYDELQNEILPKIIKNKSKEKPLRIWVAGCATGEEAYTLAICIFDALNNSQKKGYQARSEIQIFASDISEEAIESARKGIFSPSELSGVSQAHLTEYFVKTNGHYRIEKFIRDSIVFTVHNFLKDPPFGKVDLISCRNVFIYLESFLQSKGFNRFHYALRENGILVMGKSEAIGKHTDLFVPISKKNKIFSRLDGQGRFFYESSIKQTPAMAKGEETPERTVTSDYLRSAENALVKTYGPAGVVVDQNWIILRNIGNVSPFIGPSPGKPTHHLLKTAKKEIAFELRNALHRASSSKTSTNKKGIPLKIEGDLHAVDLEVIPLNDLIEPHYLVTFRKKRMDNSLKSKIWNYFKPYLSINSSNGLERQNKELERELEQVREDMRRISEEQEASNEELQSANEELRSNNEEMQSINEELETSKEELQSTNEELVVVNKELTEKQQELNTLLDDVDAIISTMREPFLILDSDFRIQKGNTAYYQTFNTSKTDVEGKQLFEIQSGMWNKTSLRSLLNRVVPENKTVTDHEIIFIDGEISRTFLFNAQKILGEEKSKKRILLAISDITERKNIEISNRETIDHLGRTNEQLDQFVNITSHDLQEPLRKITTFSNYVVDRMTEISNDELYLILNKIRMASERMSTLIKDLNQYAVLKDKKEFYENTDLNDILHNLIMDFEIIVQEKEAELKVEKLPTLTAIPIQLNQLFYNLISNALKFSRDNVKPKVTITSTELSKSEIEEIPSLNSKQKYYKITVQDNGIGFTLKDTDKIFTIFQRLHPSSKVSGTGIGLAICKKIVENHKGYIHANSKEGEGSSFHVILPKNNVHA